MAKIKGRKLKNGMTAVTVRTKGNQDARDIVDRIVGGKLGASREIARVVGTCAGGDCHGRHYAKGFCKKHYTQVLRHGKLTPERERGAARECPAPVGGGVCRRNDVVNGYCRKHRAQVKRHRRLTPERERKKSR